MSLINLSLAIYYIIILWTILYISLVFHELGHYFFRYIFKIKTNKVRIGSGWRIFRIGVIEFNILPTSGKNEPYTYYYDTSKLKKIIVYFGGVLANLIVALFFNNIWWMAWNVYMIIGNLIPYRRKNSISDGLFILALFFNMSFYPYQKESKTKGDII